MRIQFHNFVGKFKKVFPNFQNIKYIPNLHLHFSYFFLISFSSCYSRYGFRRVDSYSSRLRAGSQNWSFVFDPAGRLCYYWSMVVSLAFLYNFWVIIYRFAFREIDGKLNLIIFYTYKKVLIQIIIEISIN